ncbi:hypothetical protein [Ectropis obliqua nucleopolyhedrovirus]|uniref:Uncharacterized protein n=1 Tax=Ectropis obliqua nucleopolyhedrovirus TaxID=59376 RepID=A0EYZ4_9ABAC|nr:hypothetical protein EONV_gp091 [Ectropis obliqua nucleopolyhedrovirus]ABI35774.1 hypothetical protein [Ectropis obliqua nucleopolyhedrovirus]QWV59641.1 hypothetical protein EONV_gp091 [Ectropis obliqua nucleopolyhedrovirus]UYO72888.1 hypothetical protein EONV-gp091 [Ectropis obliqua nucleopolyhedrovirus]
MLNRIGKANKQNKNVSLSRINSSMLAFDTSGTTSASGWIKTVSLLTNLTDNTSNKFDNRHLFYDICYKLIVKALSTANVHTLFTFQNIFDTIIGLEQSVFSKSIILNYIVKFLIVYSDGNDVKSAINLKLLNYFLTKYNVIL